MWINTSSRLPNPGQRVFYATRHMIYRSQFHPEDLIASDDGPLWRSLSGFRVTHWMPVEDCKGALPTPPPVFVHDSRTLYDDRII